jgi:hypothetical protein
MTRFACVALAGCLLVSSLLGAEPPTTPAVKIDPAAVARTIKQLESDDYTVRDAAQKALERLGPAALPLLRQAAQDATDPEVRRRLEAVIPKLEQVAALAPTRVTLNVTNQPVGDVIKELARQSGYEIKLWPSGNFNEEGRVITLNLKDVTFWEALERVCELGGLTQEGWHGPDQAPINLRFGDSYPNIAAYNGPFRVIARGFRMDKTIEFSGGPRHAGNGPIRQYANLQITLGISSEPRLPLVGAGQPIFTEAVDETGQSLLPESQPHSSSFVSYGGYRMPMHIVTGNLRPAAGTRVKLIKGTIPVTVVYATKPKITIERIQTVKDKTFKEGNTTLTIDEVTENGAQLVLRLTITEAVPQGARNFLLYDSNALAQRLVLTDAQGNEYRTHYPNSMSSNGTTIQATFTYNLNNPNGKGFQPPPAGGAKKVGPLTLTYIEWSTMTHEVPFEFRDLPLP